VPALLDVPELIGNPLLWYSLAGAAYFVVGAFVLISRSSGLLRSHLLALALSGVAWSGLSAALLTGLVPAQRPLAWFLADMVLMIAWFSVLYRLLRGPYRQSMPETVRRGLYLFWGVLATVVGVAAWLAVFSPGIDPSGTFPVLGLSVALLCFALAAQLNRDAPIEDSLALRIVAVAGGLISGTHALLFGVAVLAAASPPWLISLRALIAGTSGALLLMAVRRRPQWSLATFVSPQARTYAPRLVAIPGAMLLLLVLTPLVRSMEAPASRLFATALILVVGLPVAGLLFSERLSARLRVFVSKHFLPFRYDYREEWLRLIDTLASPDHRLPLPERSVKAVAQIVGSPAGVLWMRHHETGPFVCVANWRTPIWPDAAVSSEDPVLRFMDERQWILDTAELDRDPALYEGLERPSWLEQFPDALLIVPLVSNEVLIGFIVLFQSSSAFRLTFEEIDLLRTSGRQVAAYLAQYEADKQLAEAQQFEAFNRLTAFVMHDLKNLIAQQSLMVKNAAKHKGNPAFFEDAIATIENSVARMNKLLRQLQGGETPGPRQRVRLADALREAISKAEDRQPEPSLDADDLEVCAEIDKERFTSVVAHLIRNGQEATRGDGSVTVGLRQENGHALIRIADDGCGMDPEFVRTRLFRPFDSTKGSQGMGIGAYQARTFVAESGGAMDVRSKPGRGTEVLISLPAALPEEAGEPA
jgi:putative PEP-CTERM system histidine kinase